VYETLSLGEFLGSFPKRYLATETDGHVSASNAPINVRKATIRFLIELAAVAPSIGVIEGDAGNEMLRKIGGAAMFSCL
jgi:hypothetical protein